MHRRRGSGPTFLPEPGNLSLLAGPATSGSGGSRGSSAPPGLRTQGFPRLVAQVETRHSPCAGEVPRVQSQPAFEKARVVLGRGKGHAGRRGPVGRRFGARKRSCTREFRRALARTLCRKGELEDGLVRYFRFYSGPPSHGHAWAVLILGLS